MQSAAFDHDQPLALLWIELELLVDQGGWHRARPGHIFNRMAQDRPRPDDVNKPGGWLIEETIRDGLKRYFKVYELDEEQAVELARAYGATGRARAVKKLNIHEFTAEGMRPGDVKQHG